MMRNLYVLAIFALFFSTAVYAGDVTKVKGSGALIDLKGEAASPGDLFYTLSSDGKKRGIIQITKVKGDKAIGKIMKGKVDVGMTTERKGTNTASSGGGGGKHSKATGGGGTSRSYWGGLLGYAMDKMTVNVNSATSSNQFGVASIAGSAFSAKGFFDYELFPQIWFRGMAGLEGFNVTGSNICGSSNTSACTAQIYYATADFTAHYSFSTGTFRPWLGGGIGLMFPASKSATALDTNSISTTTVFLVQGGFDYFLNKDMFIPFSVEYGMLPKSNEVDASWMEIRIGLGIPF